MMRITAPADAVVHSGRTIGLPDGPPAWHAEFGCTVGTFVTRHANLDDPLYQTKPCLMFHVPHHFRGPYRPDELGNFDPDVDYRVDHTGMMLCEAVIRRKQSPNDGKECRRKAANRQPRCESHGARLHPLDKTGANINFKDPALMTRMELLQAGYIDVEDLSDEELRNGVASKGKHVRITKDLYQKITQRHFARAQELLQEGLLPAVQALNHIAQGSAYEPADRIKAATYIIERVMGKTPDVLITKEVKEPWQQLVAGVATISREESRARRSGTGHSGDTIDAEVVGEDEDWEDQDSEGTPDDAPTMASTVEKFVFEEATLEPLAEEDSASNLESVKAATQRRYKMRSAGRASAEDGPIVLGSNDAQAAADVTLGSPGEDQVR